MCNNISIPIFMSFDEGYAPYASTCIASICDNTKKHIEFFIIDCGIKNDTKNKVELLKKIYQNLSIEWISFDTENFLKDFKTCFHFSKAMYGRIFIPILKKEIDKAIYLDVDTICLSDISELFDESLDGYPLGAVWEDYMEEKGHNKEHLTRLGIKEGHKYFNSGVLLLDLKAWREKNITNTVLGYEPLLKDKLIFPDQDLLNYSFANGYKILNERYNVTAPRARKHYSMGKLVDCVIRHFEGGKKPWLCHPLKLERMKSNHIGMKSFWHYAKKTSFYNEMISKFPIYFLFFKNRKKIK